MLIDAMAGDESSYNMWIHNGGSATISSYGGYEEIRRLHQTFFINLSVYYEDEYYFFAHAGINPNVPLSEQTEHDLLWIRDEFERSNVRFPKKIVHGHTVHHLPYADMNKICVDTGVAWGGPLTAVKLPEEEFIQVHP